jgi:hypothetical protein
VSLGHHFRKQGVRNLFRTGLILTLAQGTRQGFHLGLAIIRKLFNLGL